MNITDLIVEIFYHIGGISLVILSLFIIYKSFTLPTTPSPLGLIITIIGGAYLGFTLKSLYRVLILKEKYKIGV